MAAYRRVYDSRHLQADCQEVGSAPGPYARSRVWATFTFFNFRMHHLVVKFSFKKFFCLRRQRGIDPLTKILRTLLQALQLKA